MSNPLIHTFIGTDKWVVGTSLFVFSHKGAPAPVKLWGALALPKKFCSCGEPQGTLIEQSYVGPYNYIGSAAV